MTINILRGRTTRARREPKPPNAIGEPDARVFNCPKCSRPLSEGTPRCPGCGQRLILGVAIRRAAILSGFGLIVGMFIGGVITSGVIGGLLDSAGRVVGVTPAEVALPTTAASSVPIVTPVPAEPAPAVPAAALSALTQMARLDGRMAVDAAALIDPAGSSGADLARGLRALAADAANGADQVARMAGWAAGAWVAGDRAAFYTKIAGAARDALRVTVTNDKAYRKAATSVLKILQDLASLDAASRDLASTVSLDLPPVDLGVLAPN